MATQHVGFLNKNLFRKYPLQATSLSVDTTGRDLPLSLFSSIAISTIYGQDSVFISKIFVNGDFINVVISHKTLTGQITLGVFAGVLSSDFQTFTLIPAVNSASGIMTIGTKESWSLIPGTSILSYENGVLEASAVTCVPIPGVSSITDQFDTARGFVTLDLVNIVESLESPNIVLDVKNPRLVTARNDQQSVRLNCRTNVISAINSVKPDADGNIDLYGILPVQVIVLSDGVQIVTPSLDPRAVCGVKEVIPPIPEINPESYPDILTKLYPEWKCWPQFIDFWSSQGIDCFPSPVTTTTSTTTTTTTLRRLVAPQINSVVFNNPGVTINYDWSEDISFNNTGSFIFTLHGRHGTHSNIISVKTPANIGNDQVYTPIEAAGVTTGVFYEVSITYSNGVQTVTSNLVDLDLDY